MRVAGEYGDGLVFAIPPRGIAVPEALQHVQEGAERVGRTLAGFRNCALTNIVLLEPGEAVDSERIIRLVGPNVMASFYYFFDEVHEKDIEPPAFLHKYWKRYCDLVAEVPPEHWHFRTHELHYTALHPGEAELIDAIVRQLLVVGNRQFSGRYIFAGRDSTERPFVDALPGLREVCFRFDNNGSQIVFYRP